MDNQISYVVEFGLGFKFNNSYALDRTLKLEPTVYEEI